ncbi:hypothetical protein EP7_005022 [Isosphaeraceae bacterium EP7]
MWSPLSQRWLTDSLRPSMTIVASREAAHKKDYGSFLDRCDSRQRLPGFLVSAWWPDGIALDRMIFEVLQVVRRDGASFAIDPDDDRGSSLSREIQDLGGNQSKGGVGLSQERIFVRFKHAMNFPQA